MGENIIFCKLLGGMMSRGRIMVSVNSCFWIARFFLICLVLVKTRLQVGFVSHSTRTILRWDLVCFNARMSGRLATTVGLGVIPKVRSVFHSFVSAVPVLLSVCGVYADFLPSIINPLGTILISSPKEPKNVA
jgi:hypothetical protein